MLERIESPCRDVRAFLLPAVRDLPSRTFIVGSVIRFCIFDATGRKYKKRSVLNGHTETTDYIGTFQYQNGALDFMHTAKGRLVRDGSDYHYEYFLKGHLGNTRVSLRYYDEGMVEDYYREYYNEPPSGLAPYWESDNMYYSPVGALNFSSLDGQELLHTSSVLADTRVALSAMLYQSLPSEVNLWVRIKDSNGKTLGEYYTDNDSQDEWSRHETGSIDITVDGSIEVWISHTGTSTLYFDDLYIEKYRGHEIVQRDDYYPFGLAFNSTTSSPENLYKFNGNEEQKELRWYDFNARMYDASLGRFSSIDPLTEVDQESWTPYHFSYNNPTRFNDPSGLYSTEEWMRDNGVTQDDLITIYRAPDDTENNESEEDSEETPSFDELWSNYPSDELVHINPANGKDFFSNHCAINVSECLIKSGVSLKGFKGTKCYGTNCKSVHAIRAQELADFLKIVKKFSVVELTGENFEEHVGGKTGIIFFKDYWQRPREKGTSRRTGDHIDLWNKNELASIGLIMTYMRRWAPEFSENYLDMSDLRKSKQVLFFEIE